MDSIGNGVQVLQAANTGITSLQSLVSNAQSIANQVLQAPTGYSTKSTVASAAITGATANNLLGTGTAATSGTVTAGAFTTLDLAGVATPPTSATITGSGFSTLDLSGSNSVTLDLVINGTDHGDLNLNDYTVGEFTTAGGTLSGSDTDADLSAQDVANVFNYLLAGSPGTITSNPTGPFTVVNGELQITASGVGTGSSLAISSYQTYGTADIGLGTTGTITGAPAGTTSPAQDFTVAVDGGTAKDIALTAANVTAYNTANGTSLDASSLSATDVANLINYQDSSTVASVVGGKLTFTSGTTVRPPALQSVR